MKKLSAITSFVILLGLSSQTSASLILQSYASDTPTPTSIGGYTMTDFAFIDITASTNSVASPLGGAVDFSVALNGSTANDTTWWNNGEVFNYDIFTTNVSLVKFTLPEDTLAFSFNVGANLTSTGQNAWLSATEKSDAGGISKTLFNVNHTHTPGFGIYVDNSKGCSSISEVTIDPDFWGFGNFSISRGDCSENVPEPSIIALFAVGLFGLGFARRRKHS